MTTTVIVNLVLTLLLVCFSAIESAAQPIDADIREGVESINSAFIQAVKEGDAEGVASLFTEDAVLLAPHFDPIEGREGVIAYMRGVIEEGLSEIDRETTELSQYGDAVVEIGEYTLFAGDRRTDQGKYLVVWLQEDGNWRLHRNVMNTSKSQRSVSQTRSDPSEKLQISGASASSAWSGGYAAHRAFDGSKSSYWSSKRGDAEGAWVELLLREPKTVTDMRLFTSARASGAPLKEVTLAFSDGSRQTKQLRGLLEWEDIELEPVTTESVRIIVNDQFTGRGGNRGWVNIHEVMLMGY